MKEYHKIDSVYKRDGRGKFILGEFSRPEFEYLADLPWLWTEKIDGTNIRVMWDGDQVKYGGKTDNAQIPTKLYDHLQGLFGTLPRIQLLVDTFGTDSSVCLYGEGFGAGIQKGGGNYSPDQKFILFDVKIGNWWLERANVDEIAAKLGIPSVPTHWGQLTLNEMIDEVILHAEPSKIPTSRISDNARIEGFVGVPLVPLFARNGDRIITKIKYRDFQ